MLINNRYSACPLCAGKTFSIRFSATTALPVVGCGSSGDQRITDPSQHGDIVQCQRCGMAFTNPRPDTKQLFRLYKRVSDPGYLKELQARMKSFETSLMQLHRYCKPPGRLLDIGCFTGTFMQLAHAAGWQTDGVELSSWAAAIAKDAVSGTVYEQMSAMLPPIEKQYDVITMWDVIEHLARPMETLKDIHRLLLPQGILGLCTHLIDSRPARLLGRYYPFYIAFHLVHFSRRTITHALNAQGFEVIGIQPHRRFVSSGLLLKSIAGKWPWLPGRTYWTSLAARPSSAGFLWAVPFTGLFNIFAVKNSVR